MLIILSFKCTKQTPRLSRFILPAPSEVFTEPLFQNFSYMTNWRNEGIVHFLLGEGLKTVSEQEEEECESRVEIYKALVRCV